MYYLIHLEESELLIEDLYKYVCIIVRERVNFFSAYVVKKVSYQEENNGNKVQKSKHIYVQIVL